MQMILKVIMLVFLFAAGISAQAGNSAASDFYFPRFVANSSSASGIVVFNPNYDDAAVSLSLTDKAGKLIKKAFVTVPSRSQIVQTANQLFGSADIDGSLQLTSQVSGLVAYYRTFDIRGTYADGADSVQEDLSLIFPLVSGSPGGFTELSLLNTNIKNASVELSLWSFSGSLMATALVQVPRGGTFRSYVGDIFPGVKDFTAASHVTAASKPANFASPPQTVSGTSLVSILPLKKPDLASLNALTLTQTLNSGAIPYFRTGSRYFSTLSVANVEPAPVDVTLSAMRNDGSRIGSARATLAAHGGLRQPIEKLFPVLASGNQEGWMIIQATGRVASTMLFGREDAGAFSSIPLQRTPIRKFVFPQAVHGSGFLTEISLANPSANASYADVFVVDAGGETVASSQIIVPPGGRVSGRLDQIMIGFSSLAGGFVAIRSTEPLFAGASVWSESLATVSGFAPGDPLGVYEPAPPKIFTVLGTVTLNGRPAANFPVVLSGSVEKVATTDDEGGYLFAGLPAGYYWLTVELDGFRFHPSPVGFELNLFSKRQDFEGFTAQNGILVKPASFAAGSTDVTATIYGRNFNETSAAFVGPARMDTVLIDPTQLRVQIPDYLLKFPSEFELYVVTDGFGSDPYTIKVSIPRPVLSSLETARDIVEGSPAGVITLKGSGFHPEARVRVNGSSDGIIATWMTSTEMVALVPADYFAEAGIYPVTVENPYPDNAESNIQLLTVFYPKPAIEHIAPEVVSARVEDSSGPLQLDVFGYGFRRGAVVLIDSAPLPTVYCEVTAACLSEHLIAVVDPKFLRQSGFRKISVHNPAPYLEPSQIGFLRVESLQPTVTSLLPGNATLLGVPSSVRKYRLPITVNGTNFDPKAAVGITAVDNNDVPKGSEQWLCGENAPDCEGSGENKVIFISSTQLYFYFPVSYPESIGRYILRVANPQPGGGVSKTMSFVITEAAFVANPFLIFITPEKVIAGGPAFTLTVNGTNFQPGSVINFFSAPLVTTFVNENQLRAEVGASLIKTAGRRPITVTNPGNGGTSNKLFIQVD